MPTAAEHFRIVDEYFDQLEKKRSSLEDRYRGPIEAANAAAYDRVPVGPFKVMKMVLKDPAALAEYKRLNRDLVRKLDKWKAQHKPNVHLLDSPRQLAQWIETYTHGVVSSVANRQWFENGIDAMKDESTDARIRAIRLRMCFPQLPEVPQQSRYGLNDLIDLEDWCITADFMLRPTAAERMD